MTIQQGGLRAIVWTQLVQGIVIVTSMIVVLVCGISEIGGLEIVWHRSLAGGRIYVPEYENRAKPIIYHDFHFQMIVSSYRINFQLHY